MDPKLSEFLALSAKVSDKTATDGERVRWRNLRAELSKPTPVTVPGQTPREHGRTLRKLRVHYAPVAEMAVTFTDEIGGGGLRFRTHKHMDNGTPLVVHLDVPYEKATPLTVEARVVWSRREGGHFLVGVELVNVPAEDAERLAALLHAKP